MMTVWENGWGHNMIWEFTNLIIRSMIIPDDSKFQALALRLSIWKERHWACEDQGTVRQECWQGFKNF